MTTALLHFQATHGLPGTLAYCFSFMTGPKGDPPQEPARITEIKSVFSFIDLFLNHFIAGQAKEAEPIMKSRSRPYGDSS
jgi:hypothetical protein